MSRVIKFRAWDKKEKRMWWNVQNAYDTLEDHGKIEGKDNCFYPCSFGEVLESDNYIVMEFTGLHDKNGKEIFESDVIKDKGYMGIVTYGIWNGAPMFYSFTEPFGTPEKLMLSIDCEVLGNIYSDPHLLEGKC